MNSISKKIFYISDDANWVIKEIGQSLKSALAAEPFFLTKTATVSSNEAYEQTQSK